MKILVVDGYKYSKDSFADYKYRAKVNIKFVELVKGDIKCDEMNLDIYTTCPHKEVVEDVLLDRKTDKVTSLQIIYWCSREDDDRAAEFIEETLKDL